MADERGRPEPVDLGRFKNVTPWDAVYGCGGDSIGYPVRKRVVEDFTDDERDLIRRAVDVLLLARRLEAERDVARAEVERLMGLVEQAHREGYDGGHADAVSGCRPDTAIAWEHSLTKIALDAGEERNANA